jgi:hypothetical protein
VNPNRYSITPEECGLLEERMQELVSGYRMVNFTEFDNALRVAAQRWSGDKTLYDHNKQLSRARLMRKVISDPACDGYGVPFAWWWCCFDYRLFPGLRQDPWNEVKWWAFEELRGKRKNATFHGCQNSVKTSWMGRFAALQMAVWLQHARIYVSGPHKNAADDKIWGDSLKPALEKIKRPGNPFADSLLLRLEIGTEDAAVFDVISGESATAKFVSLESAAAVQGKKAVEHEGEGKIGITAFLMDEFIENPGVKLKQAEANLSSNHNYIGFFACNPLPQKVQHVALIKFSEPTNIDRNLLRKEVHFAWPTAYGKCYRFAWQNCPNNILKRTVWPYLINQEMVTSGENKDADLVAAQLDAWAWTTTGISYLDEPAVRLSGTYLTPVWRTARTRFMAVDCAFGGSDPATITIIEAGTASIPDASRQTVDKQVFAGVCQEVLPVKGDFEFTDEWFKTMIDLYAYSGGGFPESVRIAPFVKGQLIPSSYQLAQLVLEAALKYDVPAKNITFDSSQRGDCTTIMLASLGRQNVRYYYEGTRTLLVEEELTKDWFLWPFEFERTDDQGHKIAKKWSELCSSPISMIWMFACNFIRHGGLVNGSVVKRGIDELIARPIETGKRGNGFKRDVMSKRAMKDAGIKSPTWGEGLSMAIYLGVRFLGLWPIAMPHLTTVVQDQQPMGEVIRAGRSMRFDRRMLGDHR